MQRDEQKRKEFIKEIKSLSIEDLVYLDESTIEHDIVKDKAWLLKGTDIIQDVSGQRHNRTTIIAALNKNDDIIAPIYYAGTTDTLTFCYWLENHLVQELKPNQIVIMDNASIHKSNRIREIIEKANCRLLYLPPYSPDLNPIEHYWNFVKHYVGKLRLKNDRFFDNLDKVLNMKYVSTEM